MPWIIGATLTVVAPLLLVYLYLGRKVARALVDLKGWTLRKARWRVTAAILYLNAFPVVFLVAYWIVGREASRLFSGESLLLDLLLVYPFWFALTIAAQSFFLLLAVDVLNFIPLRISPTWKQRWTKIRPRFVVSVLGVMALYCSIVIVKDTWTVRISERTIPVADAKLDGLRFALITDVQGDARTSADRLRAYVEDVNSLKPDVIFFAGDLVTSGLDYIDSSADVLGGLKARIAKIAVMGDHDYFSDRVQVRNRLLQNSFIVLEDSSTSLDVGPTSITITGITETYRQRISEDAFSSASENIDGPLKVLLVHQPSIRVVEMAEARGYDLLLAGHTHGGGVAIGIPGIYTVAPSNFETRYVSGFYQVGSMLVAVSNGIGMTLAPIRFHAPSEITLLTLTKGT
jgi:predicted MPP superfamily phosphohydrolase